MIDAVLILGHHDLPIVPYTCPLGSDLLFANISTVGHPNEVESHWVESLLNGLANSVAMSTFASSGDRLVVNCSVMHPSVLLSGRRLTVKFSWACRRSPSSSVSRSDRKGLTPSSERHPETAIRAPKLPTRTARREDMRLFTSKADYFAAYIFCKCIYRVFSIR